MHLAEVPEERLVKHLVRRLAVQEELAEAAVDLEVGSGHLADGDI